MTRFSFNTVRALSIRSGDVVHIPNINGQWTQATATVISKSRCDDTGTMTLVLKNGNNFRVLPMNQVAVPRSVNG